MEIEGKVVAITGASRGIGAATARLLARHGARVVLAGRDGDALDALEREITQAGGQAAAQLCDVTRAQDVVEFADLAVRRFGRLDVFVSNAGIAVVAPLAEGKVSDWDSMIDVNLGGVLHSITAAMPVFQRQGAGQFVTVTSTSAHKWVPGQGVYAATKAGVRALCEVLRQEVSPRIRVSMICPGAAATDFGSGGDPETRARFAAIAMDPSAVAEAIAFAIGQPAGVNVGEVVVGSAPQM
jgi:NADP-dependent 3-hydroxy acid dehydrogenase YdfG